mgnify:CR=1 FL=1
MTRNEVIRLIGEPRSNDLGNMNYGNIWIRIENGIVGCLVDAKYYHYAYTCSAHRNYPQSYPGLIDKSKTYPGLIDKQKKGGLIYIEATGTGTFAQKYSGKKNARIDAERAAFIAAAEKLLQIIGELRPDGITDVKSIMKNNDKINDQILNLVREAEIVKYNYMSDGTIDANIRVPHQKLLDIINSVQ